MAEQMVERVAKAIKDAAVIVLDYSDVTYLEDPMVVARAAIEAMREPTREMLIGYIRHMGYDPDEPADTIDKQLVGVGIVQKWQAMIDAALKD